MSKAASLPPELIVDETIAAEGAVEVGRLGEGHAGANRQRDEGGGGAGWRDAPARSCGHWSAPSEVRRAAMVVLQTPYVWQASRRPVADEAVVVAAGRADVEAGLLDAPRRSELAGIAPAMQAAHSSTLRRVRSFSGLAADDVGERQPPARPQHARGLGEHACLDRREVDHAVRDHDVEARVVERELVDACPRRSSTCRSRRVAQRASPWRAARR